MKYLAYYDTPDNAAENRSYALAATNKITYICSALNRAGIPVEILSASATENPRGCKGKTVQLQNQTILKLFPSSGTGGRLKRVIGRILFRARYLGYLLTHTHKNEKILAYHSMAYAPLIMFARKIKKFYLILETEEIYADVGGEKKERQKELKLIRQADAYIFPAQRMNDLINTEGKPYTLICGTYQAEKDRGVEFDNPQWKDKIHCVYAGTFDPRKGGGQIAAQVARYLPAKYHMHLLGFGTEADVQNIKNTVEEISRLGGCGISYEGCLRGEEYIRFLQACQIGLSTQNPNAVFNDTSFPSKILTYMANGMQVVTVRIPVVEESPIGKWMAYYDQPTPQAVAEAIQSVIIDDSIDSRSIIKELDEKIVADIKRLLEGQ